MVLIDSTYINASGGKILLEYLITTISQVDSTNDFIFIFDKRFESDVLSLSSLNNKIVISGSEYERFLAYKRIFKLFSIESVLCLANVPPPFRLNIPCEVYIYFHNLLLLDSSQSNHSCLSRIKFELKSYYLLLTSRRHHVWLVQSDLIKSKLKKFLGRFGGDVLSMPFFEPLSRCRSSLSKEHQYFYPAEGVAQKNHILLLKAWEVLAQRNCTPRLVLTVDVSKYPSLGHEIDRLQRLNVDVVNMGYLTRIEVLNLYDISKFVVYPSLKESFGLPLVEATQFGCLIITPILDYVDVIIEPSIQFEGSEESLIEVILEIESGLFLSPPVLKIENKVFELINLLKKKHV